ncbi:Zinc finger protein 22-like, partial [Homarus americanus]
MEQMSDNTSENKEYDSDISTVSLGFTKNEEEIVKSIAKTLVGDIPFFNIDNGKVKGSQECPLDSKVSQVLVSNLESKDTLQNTIPDLNISSKPKRNKDLADGARISPARGSLTPSVGDVIIKIENSETSQKLDGNILEGDYEFVEFDDKGLVIETKNGAGILRGRNKREETRVNTAKKESLKYMCKLCGMSSQTPSNLRHHMMMHTGQKPHTCLYCGMTFHQSHLLIEHICTHTGENPLECEVCDETFTTKSALKSHMKVHAEIFSRLNSLSLHKKVHNTNGTYRYVPKKMEPVQNIDNSGNGSVDKNVDTNNYLSEELEVKDRCIPIKENNLRSKSTNASFEEFTCSQNMKTQVMDSCFPTITEPPSDLTRSIMTDVEQEMVSVPHPDIVRDALATGTVLESQGEDGQGYLIVLPKALAEKDYTLIALPPMPASKIAMVSESVVLQENEEQGHNNCDLFVWDNDIDAVTEVAFDPERELLPVEEIYSKAKKQKKEKVICDKTFLDSCYKKQHMRTHEDEAQYKCDRCDAVFKTKSTFKKHRLHHVDNWGICELCGLQFEGVKALNVHKQTSHGRDINDFKKEGHDVNETIKLEGESDHVSSSEEIKENKCEMCNRSIGKHARHVTVTDNDGRLNICRRCSTRAKSTKLPVLIVRCKEEQNEEESEIHNNQNEEQETIPKESFVKIDRKKICEKTFETIRKSSEPSICNEYKETCFELEDSKKNINHCEENIGNICDMCGKAFGRASALTFHKQMSHRNDYDEEEERLLTNYRSENDDLDNKMKMSEFIKETTVTASSQYQHPCAPLEIKVEAEDISFSEIEYCKCSFCGIKLSDMSMLNKHISQLHPEEISHMKSQADI